MIDCPDLPLNVSRSFLQNDGYVKKMAAYITRKVADRLVSEFNTRREDYEKYWRDIHPFVKYGCIRDEKFFDRVKEAILFEKTSGGFTTLKELEDKGETVYYTSDAKRQAHLIAQYTSQDKDVIVLDTLIDNNFISFLEFSGKEQNLKFQRVDASTEGLTEEGETDETARASLEEKFRKALDDKELEVKLTRFKSDDLPATITVDEQSRRFTDMSRQWGGGFQMPEHRTLTLNEKHPLVKYLISAEEEGDITQMVCRQIVDLCEMARQPLVGRPHGGFPQPQQQAAHHAGGKVILCPPNLHAAARNPQNGSGQFGYAPSSQAMARASRCGTSRKCPPGSCTKVQRAEADSSAFVWQVASSTVRIRGSRAFFSLPPRLR